MSRGTILQDRECVEVSKGGGEVRSPVVEVFWGTQTKMFVNHRIEGSALP